jgi:hypothetical protein
MAWGGVTSATSRGQALTHWTLTSASGFDYTHAFIEPEPTGAKLVLTAVALAVALGLAQRRGLFAAYRQV